MKKIKKQKFRFEIKSTTPDKMIVKDEVGKIIASYFYNMTGFVAEFRLFNERNIQPNFGERTAAATKRDFRKAIREGFIYINHEPGM